MVPFAAKDGAKVGAVETAHRVVEQVLADRHHGRIGLVSRRLNACQRQCVRGGGGSRMRELHLLD